MLKLKLDKLNQKDKRALKLGVFGIAAIIVFLFVTSVFENWSAAKNSLKAVTKNLETINGKSAKQQSNLSIVPVLEMPSVEEKQKFLFIDKFNEQLRKAGLPSQPLQVSRAAKSEQTGYKLMRFQYSGKCKFEQVIDLLSGLNENPYLVAVEEIEMKCDPKKRQEMDLNLIVSSFVR